MVAEQTKIPEYLCELKFYIQINDAALSGPIHKRTLYEITGVIPHIMISVVVGDGSNLTKDGIYYGKVTVHDVNSNGGSLKAYLETCGTLPVENKADIVEAVLDTYKSLKESHGASIDIKPIRP